MKFVGAVHHMGSLRVRWSSVALLKALDLQEDHRYENWLADNGRWRFASAMMLFLIRRVGVQYIDLKVYFGEMLGEIDVWTELESASQHSAVVKLKGEGYSLHLHGTYQHDRRCPE
jgi:hypothetical protein